MEKHIPCFRPVHPDRCGRERRGILDVQRILNSNGYTSYTESTLGSANDRRESGRAGSRGIYIYKSLAERGLLSCRVSIGFYTGDNGRQSAELMEKQLSSFDFPDFTQPEWLQMKMCKIFCDGVHLSHTAWMLDDYPGCTGDHGKSALYHEGMMDAEQERERELAEMILCATRHGFQAGQCRLSAKEFFTELSKVIRELDTAEGKNSFIV